MNYKISPIFKKASPNFVVTIGYGVFRDFVVQEHLGKLKSILFSEMVRSGAISFGNKFLIMIFSRIEK